MPQTSILIDCPSTFQIIFSFSFYSFFLSGCQVHTAEVRDALCCSNCTFYQPQCNCSDCRAQQCRHRGNFFQFSAVTVWWAWTALCRMHFIKPLCLNLPLVFSHKTNSLRQKFSCGLNLKQDLHVCTKDSLWTLE